MVTTDREIIEMALETNVITGFVATALRRYLQHVDELADCTEKLMKIVQEDQKVLKDALEHLRIAQQLWKEK